MNANNVKAKIKQSRFIGHGGKTILPGRVLIKICVSKRNSHGSEYVNRPNVCHVENTKQYCGNINDMCHVIHFSVLQNSDSRIN